MVKLDRRRWTRWMAEPDTMYAKLGSTCVNVFVYTDMSVYVLVCGQDSAINISSA